MRLLYFFHPGLDLAFLFLGMRERYIGCFQMPGSTSFNYLMYAQTMSFQLCMCCSQQFLHYCKLRHFQDRPFFRYSCDVTLGLSPTWIEDVSLCTNHLIRILDGRYLPVNRSGWKVWDTDWGHKTSVALEQLGLLLKSNSVHFNSLVEVKFLTKSHLLINVNSCINISQNVGVIAQQQ